MEKTILLVNGPNLNLLGEREPEIYGKTTLQDIEEKVEEIAIKGGFKLLPFQSNHEGEIVDFLHQNSKAKYLIINAGALTHTSVALSDALSALKIPFIEVHISNVHARESFRHHSYLSPMAKGIIVGCGIEGYYMAAQLIADRLNAE